VAGVNVAFGAVLLGMEEMNFRLPAVAFIFVIASFGAVQLGAQANSPAQANASPATSAAGRKIVTKDPEYLKLLDPPKDAEFFQTYSKAYRDAFAEINSKFSDITDATLRTQARKDEWDKVLKTDGDKFQYEADVTFRDAKVSYSQNHRDSWLPIGPVYYDENNKVLRAKPYTTAPIVASLRLPMQPADLQKLYDKYHLLVADEIDQKTHDYVAKAGPGSNCARNPDICYKYSYQEIEQNMRTNRIVAVAQGDLEAGKIERLFLADYDTEVVILDLDSANAALSNIAWRFSPGPVPVKPAEPEAPAPVEAQAPAAPAEPTAPVAPTEPATPASQNSQGAAGSTASQSAPAAPAPTKAPAPRVVVPANVEAASIVTQTKPVYPPQARAKLIQGEVLLHAIIDKEGKISEVHVLSGDDLLAPAATEAVRHWQYKPMLVDGEAREVDTTITVTFSLKE
jgi:TonB family protein